MNELTQKLYENALLNEQLQKLTIKEKHHIIKELNKTKSLRQISKDLNIPKSTIQDWSSLRQNSPNKKQQVILSYVHAKLKKLNPNEITDWGRIELIQEELNRIKRGKNDYSTRL